MQVSIVIVSFNGKNVLCDALTSIVKSKTEFTYEIIVVDNNSSDGTIDKVKREFPQVKIVSSGSNLGFAKANNIGIKIATGQFVLILNPDIIFSDYVLDKMIEFMNKNKECGIATCKLLNPNNTIQDSVRRFAGFLDIVLCRSPLRKFMPERYRNKVDELYLMKDWEHLETKEIDWFLGAFMFAPRKVLLKVGMFNERFFMYFEDVDLCYRIKKNGYKVMYFHEPSIIHLHGQESTAQLGKMSLIHLKSAFLFYFINIKLAFKLLYFAR